LKQRNPPTRPDQAWVADITYVWTVAGWVYLAAVMDLCSRKIVGWSIGESLETSLVEEALKRGLALRRPGPGLLHHSDRGIQYASSAFRALLHSWHIAPSMSGKGNCYDNAAMEAFWSTLKTEMIHQSHFESLAQARLAVFDYIETFYNRQRLHSALGFKSPVEFEQQLTYKYC
jgi:transposase InsO family protein